MYLMGFFIEFKNSLAPRDHQIFDRPPADTWMYMSNNLFEIFDIKTYILFTRYGCVACNGDLEMVAT